MKCDKGLDDSDSMGLSDANFIPTFSHEILPHLFFSYGRWYISLIDTKTNTFSKHSSHFSANKFYTSKLHRHSNKYNDINISQFEYDFIYANPKMFLSLAE